jgi:phenylacetate-CoA ligase
MVNVRGVNVYPSAIEAVVRRFAEIGEFRSTVSRSAAMRALTIDVEVTQAAGDRAAFVARVSRQLREALGLSVLVQLVEVGSLPRFEMKARRFVVEA